MRLGICAIFKNEDRYLREWALYHRLIGFDGIVAYDNGSDDDGVSVLAAEDLRDFVSVVPWPQRPGQSSAYREFSRTHAQRFDWVAFIDIDEFILPLDGQTVRSCIQVAGGHSAILLCWLDFGPSGHVSSPDGLVTENYTMRFPQGDPFNHIKSLVRVADLIDCDHAHLAQVRGLSCNTRGETVPYVSCLPAGCHDNMVLNHYFTKSAADWASKVQRGRPNTDDPALRRDQMMFDSLRDHATTPDFRIQRYLPDLKMAVGRHAPVPWRRFPEVFETSAYRALWHDLAHLGDTGLFEHYLEFGLAEGRQSNSIGSREAFVGLIPPDSALLELGPATQLSQVANEQFEYVLSRDHVVRQPDLIAHLNDVGRVLRPGGYYFMVLPDKRYGPGALLAESTLADVLDAHHLSHTAHTLRSLIEHRALATHDDAARHWSGDHRTWPTDAAERARGALQEFAAIQEFGALRDGMADVVAWRFTPSSFKTLLGDLRQTGHVTLRTNRIYPTRTFASEFWVVLQK